MICLLPTAYKMLSTLLLHRLRLECDGFLSENQMGFRQHRSTRDHIVILSECIASLQESTAATANNTDTIASATANNTDTIASATFLDYAAAFDSIDHVFLDEALQLSGASLEIRAIISGLYTTRPLPSFGRLGNR